VKNQKQQRSSPSIFAQTASKTLSETEGTSRTEILTGFLVGKAVNLQSAKSKSSERQQDSNPGSSIPDSDFIDSFRGIYFFGLDTSVKPKENTPKISA
jgi:hypothetical protein